MQGAELEAWADENGRMVLPADLTKPQWLTVGERLADTREHLQWMIGTWWAYGESRRYGSAIKAAALLKIEPSTLRNYARIAIAYESANDAQCARRHALSWAHHLEAAALDPEQRTEALALAEAEEWSSKQLRQHVRALRQPAGPGKQPDPPPPEKGNKEGDADLRRLAAKLDQWASHRQISRAQAVDKLIESMDAQMRTSAKVTQIKRPERRQSVNPRFKGA